MYKVFLIAGVASTLGGCATASFAPPGVDRFNRMISPVAKSCAAVKNLASRTIERDVDGALDLMDNFELAYSCAQSDLANGRQYFEVPAFLLGIAGLVGPSLGLGPDGKLLAGTGAGVLGYGNNYYAPKAKAAVVNAAHRAVVCMQTESVGIAAFKNKPDPTTAANLATLATEVRSLVAANDRQLGIAAANPGLYEQQLANQTRLTTLLTDIVEQRVEAAIAGEIKVSADVQYFQMIRGGLGTIHSVLDERLRNSGATDTKAVFDELKALAAKHKEAKDALDKTQPKPGAQGMVGPEISVSPQQELTLKIDELRPRIETCVLQARL